MDRGGAKAEKGYPGPTRGRCTETHYSISRLSICHWRAKWSSTHCRQTWYSIPQDCISVIDTEQTKHTWNLQQTDSA